VEQNAAKDDLLKDRAARRQDRKRPWWQTVR
jgi:hypothetical protein